MNDFLAEDLNPAIYPLEKEEMLTAMLGCFDTERRYEEASEDELSPTVTLTVKNPYGKQDITILLDDSFTLLFGGCRTHFYPNEEGYKEFLSTLIGLIACRYGVLDYMADDEIYWTVWKGKLPETAAQLAAVLHAEDSSPEYLLSLSDRIGIRYFDPAFDREITLKTE